MLSADDVRALEAGQLVYAIDTASGVGRLGFIPVHIQVLSSKVTQNARQQDVCQVMGRLDGTDVVEALFIDVGGLDILYPTIEAMWEEPTPLQYSTQVYFVLST